ncbi:MAG: hypothetical protein KatS3mg031_1274 [Chitinophagales bacterium]|nr:MAG: hypothetical protein KatS3mg031_1274 [Chitinophagales bacterium]
MKKLLFLTGIFILAWTLLSAHGKDDHSEKTHTDTATIEAIDAAQNAGEADVAEQQREIHGYDAHEHVPGKLKADFSDFPTLHPLVVHFPIVLLLLAAITQLAGLFVFKKELSWVTMFLALIGCAGAYLAGSSFHPHTEGLTKKAEAVLEQHERFAEFTVWLSLAALILKAISHFFLKRKWWGEVLVAFLLIGSAYTVSTAGHFGAQLVHLEGVGPKGKFLELHENGHSHSYEH